MGPFVIMVVLVCGFWYTENHYQSRIRQARSNGWNAYFYVAMHGCKFAIQGFFFISVVFIALLILSAIINVLGFIWPKIHVDLYSWLTDIRIMSYPLFFVLSMLIAVLIAIEQGKKARRAMENEETDLDPPSPDSFCILS